MGKLRCPLNIPKLFERFSGPSGRLRSYRRMMFRRSFPDSLDDPDAFVENTLFNETRDYVRKGFGSFWNYAAIYNAEQSSKTG